jgi:hypothetical protein
MLSARTLGSLAQLLDLLGSEQTDLLFNKHGLQLIGNADLSCVFSALKDQADSDRCWTLLEEIIRTRGSLTHKVKPRYLEKERFDDLERCLALEGWLVDGRELRRFDPSGTDAVLIEDEMTREIQDSSLPEKEEIVRKLSNSAEAFCRPSPDYNACLTNARIALETLARGIAGEKCPEVAQDYDALRWGQVISLLRRKNLFTVEEEKGIVGVYGFLSLGAHRPVGLSDFETCRLGRNLALSMCWYLIRRVKAADA